MRFPKSALFGDPLYTREIVKKNAELTGSAVIHVEDTERNFGLPGGSFLNFIRTEQVKNRRKFCYTLLS